MKAENLESVAKKLVAPGKGILAADESSGTIEKRLKSVNVPSTEENRRMYREILFTTKGAGECISGVILFDETIRQKTRDGRSFVEVLEQQGIIPGIKVDKGAKAKANFPGEKITEGLDGLRERLTEYRKLGARFAKWRAVITIGDGIPTRTCIDSNAEALARYAALCQESDLVPILEPEVLMDGTHTIERHFEVTQQTLRSVFDSLAEHRVAFEGMLLKPNMVLSGKENPKQASVHEVAEATVRCLKRAVPAAVPGIVFLSGGQTDQQATEHLNAMNRIGNLPWQLSFSYGRALQAPVLKAWKGDTANVSAAQTAFHHRAWCNSKARFGKYTEEMETAKGRIMFGAAIMLRYSLGTLALVMLSGTPAQSAPQVTPNGFLVKFEVSINAPAAKVYDALVGQVGSWWNPEHTYSHDAKNLSIDPRPGGCFCEKLPNGGGIEHLRVVYVAPPQIVRFSGALGPLQASGLAGSLTWKLTSGADNTRLQLLYSVGGFIDGGFEKIARAVEAMLRAQFDRLKLFVETGKPTKAE